MSYSLETWDMDNIKPLLEALGTAFVWADRRKDKLMLHYIELLLNLAYARMPLQGE